MGLSARLFGVGRVLFAGQRAGDVTSFLKIYATLEDRQTDHQSTVVEVAGKIVEQSISILIDPGSTHSYITPRVV